MFRNGAPLVYGGIKGEIVNSNNLCCLINIYFGAGGAISTTKKIQGAEL